MPIVKHAFLPTYPALRLDPDDVTFLSDVQGGAVFAGVVPETGGAHDVVKKHIGAPQFEPITCRVGATMSPGLFEWIANAWRGRTASRNGAVLTLAANLEITSERTFSDALIEEVAFPALDASSKEPAYLTVRFAPSKIVLKPGTGKLPPVGFTKQKLWVTSNFRLDVDGLDTQYVTRIEPFAVTLPTGPHTGPIDFPNLRVHVAGSGAQSWIDWHRDFVVNGRNGDKFEKSGAIRFLAADLKTELARIDLGNVGIYALAPESTQGGQDSPPGTVRVDLYCERMQFQPGKADA